MDEIEEINQAYECGYRDGLRDNKNGACHNKHAGSGFWCSNCDAATDENMVDVGGELGKFRFCPNCGAEVVR